LILIEQREGDVGVGEHDIKSELQSYDMLQNEKFRPILKLKAILDA